LGSTRFGVDFDAFSAFLLTRRRAEDRSSHSFWVIWGSLGNQKYLGDLKYLSIPVVGSVRSTRLPDAVEP